MRPRIAQVSIFIRNVGTGAVGWGWGWAGTGSGWADWAREAGLGWAGLAERAGLGLGCEWAGLGLEGCVGLGGGRLALAGLGWALPGLA